ncbi:hypothetical protein BKA69DRAFT_1041309 [Paraphysoderma sedebokerense]|nr:hypothetical protein BKA69DRAFT_1041309 [Paraphysoderma sedebokerense]
MYPHSQHHNQHQSHPSQGMYSQNQQPGAPPGGPPRQPALPPIHTLHPSHSGPVPQGSQNSSSNMHNQPPLTPSDSASQQPFRPHMSSSQSHPVPQQLPTSSSHSHQSSSTPPDAPSQRSHTASHHMGNPTQGHTSRPPPSMNQHSYDQGPPSHPSQMQQAPPMHPGAPPPAPPPPGGYFGGGFRPLNVRDALSYLDQVKLQFYDRPYVYNKFLDIMKDFKSQSIDTPGVIDRVSTLFKGHPALITGFNTFLPPGYRIECGPNPNDPIRVITPSSMHPPGHGPPGDYPPGGFPPVGTFGPQNQHQPPFPGYGPNHPPPPAQSQPPQQPPSQQPQQPQTQQPQPQNQSSGSQAAAPKKQPVEFNHAISYVNKIKTRYSAEPEVYKQFLEILQTYQKEQKPINEVYSQVTVLFKGAPDLLDEFKQFLPDPALNGPQHPGLFAVGGQAAGRLMNPVTLGTMPSGMAVPQQGPGARLPPVGNFAPPPSHMDRDASGNKRGPTPIESALNKKRKIEKGPPGKTKPAKDAYALHYAAAPVREFSSEEFEFFDKVKRVLRHGNVYQEFLKILNLYSNDIIDQQVLVDRVEVFLGGLAPDLFENFKKLIDYKEPADDEILVHNIPAPAAEPSPRDYVQLGIGRVNSAKWQSAGFSYRRIPASSAKTKCSGRDALADEVLNDDWVSHPTWNSEVEGFVVSKKTVHEDALFKVEEERYEYDLFIQANTSVIALLEPIAQKISQMTPQEQKSFKLEPGLGGTSKTVYIRVLKKVYDEASAKEIVEYLHENPAKAVPTVLARLKQKDIEWKKAQTEWNKIWRELDSKNFYKALDVQSTFFKSYDKKALHSKQLIAEISTALDEQTIKTEITGTPSQARHQFEYIFPDKSVFNDTIKIIKTWVAKANVGDGEKEKVEGFLEDFVRIMFQIEPEPSDTPQSSNSVSSSKSNSSVTSPAVAGATKDQMDVDQPTKSAKELAAELGIKPTIVRKRDRKTSTTSIMSGTGSHSRKSFYMYCNNYFYVFFRLIQMVYHRLEIMKHKAQELLLTGINPDRFNIVASTLGLQHTKIAGKDKVPTNAAQFYPYLLEMIAKLFAGELEQHPFEEYCRAMFGPHGYTIYTIDKVVGAVIRQIQVINADAKSLQILRLFEQDRQMEKTNYRRETVYRMAVENLLDSNENTYRIEFLLQPRILTIELCTKDKYWADSEVTSEQKWSWYIDHFVVLDNTEGIDMKDLENRLPMLKRYRLLILLMNYVLTLALTSLFLGCRNLPPKNAAPPSGEKTVCHSNLELKICINTYKIFFCENTEDFFYRRRSSSSSKDSTSSSKTAALDLSKKIRRAKWQKYHESSDGWKKGYLSDYSYLDKDDVNGKSSAGNDSDSENEDVQPLGNEIAKKLDDEFQRLLRGEL